MKVAYILTAALMLIASNAAAQSPNLTGRYRCIQSCQADPESSRAYVTQNGFDLNVRDEAGFVSRGWIDWPGHVWLFNWQEGAIFSPDGMTIQFDRGRLWQRDVEAITPPTKARPKK